MGRRDAGLHHQIVVASENRQWIQLDGAKIAECLANPRIAVWVLPRVQADARELVSPRLLDAPLSPNPWHHSPFRYDVQCIAGRDVAYKWRGGRMLRDLPSVRR